MELLFLLIVDGMFLGCLYAISAFGFVIIYRATGVFNFAHGGFVAMGAFSFLMLACWAKLPLSLAFVLTLLGSFGLGYLVESVILRPLAGKPIIYPIILTVGLAAMLEGFLTLMINMGHCYTFDFPTKFTLQWTNLNAPYSVLSIFIIMLVLLITIALFIKFSSFGIFMRAAADNRSAAFSLGVNVKEMFSFSWALAAVLASMGGIGLAIIKGLTLHEITWTGLKVFAVVIIGGLYSISGVIFGGLIIGLLETLTSAYISTSLGEISPYFFMVLLLFFRPYGLFMKRPNMS